MPYEQLDLIASLIEEADFTASLAETLHQVARRVKREKFGPQAHGRGDDALTRLRSHSCAKSCPTSACRPACRPAMSIPTVEELREQTLQLAPDVTSGERGAILALLGSIERAELLIRRIDAERKSVNRASRHRPRPIGSSQARLSPGYRRQPQPSASGVSLRIRSGYLSLTTFCCWMPSPSMPMRMISPGFRKRCGFMPMPTPGGVPVVMMSPGIRVKNCER